MDVSIFLLYLPLLLLVLAAIGITAYGLVPIFSMLADKLIVGMILCLVFWGIWVWFLLWPLSKAVLSPFFKLLSAPRDKRIEVKREDAPELFALIYKIAELTHNDYPAHVYVNSSANAFVFFDARFANLFVPVKKNLEIGLGLFRNMSQQDVATCIAHEFGHFGQKDMRWGTVVYILNTFIANQMGTNKKWNSIVNGLINVAWIIGYGIVFSLAVKALGWTLYGLTIGYQKLMEYLYRKVQLAHLDLSREMGFEADAVAAAVVGSDAFVSFACKLDVISDRENRFNSLIGRLIGNNKMIPDYWGTYDYLSDYLSSVDHKGFSFDLKLSKLLSNEHQTRLKIENIYSSHPLWSQRIEKVTANPKPAQISMPDAAWSIIPQSLQDRVAEVVLSDINGQMDKEQQVETLTSAEVKREIESQYYWIQFQPYFSRRIVEFELASCVATSEPLDLEDPVALAAIGRYMGAKEDYETALSIRRPDSDIEIATYDNAEYKPEYLPMAEIKAFVNECSESVREIDKKICQYAMSKADDPQSIILAYRKIFYAEDYLEEFEQAVNPAQEKATRLLNNSTDSNNGHQYSLIKDALNELNSKVKDFVNKKYDEHIISQFVDKETLDGIAYYKENYYRGLFDGDSISGNAISLLYNTCNNLRNIHRALASQSKMFIIDTCLKAD